MKQVQNYLFDNYITKGNLCHFPFSFLQKQNKHNYLMMDIFHLNISICHLELLKSIILVIIALRQVTHLQMFAELC